MAANPAIGLQKLDNEWLYLGGSFAENLEFLCAPVAGRKNVKLLVGEAGLGKTVLVRAALKKMKSEARGVYVFWTNLEADDFIAHVLREIDPENKTAAELSLPKRFAMLAGKSNDEGLCFVLAIDEAQHLTPAALEKLGDLLDSDAVRGPEVQVILSGLPELNERLADPKARKLRDRVVGERKIEALTAVESEEYIRQRMEAFGRVAFSNEEIARIAATSGGVARVLSQRCDPYAAEPTVADALPVEKQVTSAAPERHRKLDTLPDRMELPVAPTPREIAFEDATVGTDVKGLWPWRPKPGQVVEAFAEWAKTLTGPWSGTASELAAHSGMLQQEIDSLLQDSEIHKLRKAGVSIEVHRLPGRPRMIRLAGPTVVVEEPLTKEEARNQALDEIRTDWIEHDNEQVFRSRSSGFRTEILLGLCALMLSVMVAVWFYVGSRNAKSAASGAGNGSATSAMDQATDEYDQKALSGDPDAQLKLGTMFAQQKNATPAELSSAYIWLTMAQAAGEPVQPKMLDSVREQMTPLDVMNAHFKLGQMYEKGIGCNADDVIADMFYRLAIAGGDYRSRFASSAIEGHMSKDEISDVRQRTLRWTKKHPVSKQQ